MMQPSLPLALAAPELPITSVEFFLSRYSYEAVLCLKHCMSIRIGLKENTWMGVRLGTPGAADIGSDFDVAFRQVGMVVSVPPPPQKWLLICWCLSEVEHLYGRAMAQADCFSSPD